MNAVRPLWSLLKGTTKTAGTVAATVAGGWLGYSALAIDHDAPLPPAVEAERRTFSTADVDPVSYYVDDAQEGRPLVLVHSINAAASAFEMKPLFEHYRQTRPVYALDLPGYGFSDRRDRVYSPSLFVATLGAFLQDEVGAPVDLVALSLGSEFAATVAHTGGEWVHSLALLSPTGFGEPRSIEPDTSEKIRTAVDFPLWGQAIFDLLVTRRSINYFLGKNFAGPPNAEMIDYAYAAAHQPGARNAPYYFVSGQLFTWDIRERVYEQLVTPTLVIYDKDPNISFALLPAALERNPNLRMLRVGPSCGLPQWEKLPETTQALDDFWAELG